jgi:hypothetical protein
VGRLKPIDSKLKGNLDPVDIDDDVSDHGSESVAQQLKDLDSMNKYMKSIRIPTSNMLTFNYYRALIR